ncbi:MAG: ABC transporter permease [bacterium]
MKFTDFLAVAGKHLRSRLLETIVIIIAIGLGTGVICLALGLQFASRDLMQNTQQSNFKRKINIKSGQDHMHNEKVVSVGDSFPEQAEFTGELVSEIKENCPRADYVFSSNTIFFHMSESGADNSSPPSGDSEFAKEKNQRKENRIRLQRTFPDEIEFENLEIDQGNNFTDSDVKQGNKVVVLGAGAAEKFFPKKDPLGQKLKDDNGQSFTVVGVLEELKYEEKDDSLLAGSKNEIYHNGGFIPYTAYNNKPEQKENFLQSEVNNITAGVDDVKKVKAASSQIESYLEEKFGEGFNVSHYTGLDKDQESSARGLIIAAFVASLGLLVAAVNILNLMLARVLRRTTNMGVLKALGSTRKSIFVLFLTEALLLGFLGSVLGFFFAFGGEYLINQINPDFLLTVDYRVFLSAVGIASIISLIFGVYPALKASSVNPVEALRIE